MDGIHMFHFVQVNRLQSDGYYGGVRLLMAICKIFHNYCKENNISLHEGNFKLSYDTNIPRQVLLMILIWSPLESYWMFCYLVHKS